MSEMYHELTVELGERSYPILIGRGLLGQLDLTPWVHGKQVMIVTNETVAPLYLEKALASFAGKDVDSVVLRDGEVYKEWSELNRIFDALLERRHSRKTTLVALGGGVVGDMTGFAAASYQRGVEFIQIPTTLLSQVDSSVGGKTGINHPRGKNMIGAFHQPNMVLIDTDSLRTLPANELSAGLAEVIKYGVIRDLPFFEWLEAHMPQLLTLESRSIAEAIYQSCRCKAQIVAEDERELDVRALLNLGHTFGHAIETHAGYGSWLHGAAVGVGMAMAADLSVRLGWLPAEDRTRIVSVLAAAQLPLLPPEGMTPEDFMIHMAVDKKNIDGSLRLVLLNALGDAIVTSRFDAARLQDTLRAFTDTRLH